MRILSRTSFRLVDFSPWGATTEPCLFDWDELQNLSNCELRVVRDETECHGMLGRDLSKLSLYVSGEEAAKLPSGAGGRLI